MITKEFILSGQAIFTVECPKSFQDATGAPAHYTYRIRHNAASDRWPESYFAQLLTGPDNTRNFTYLGKVGKDHGELWLTAKSKMGEGATAVCLLKRVLARIFAGQGDQIEAAGFQVHHEGRCGKCGRRLTVPESITTGIGPECAKSLGLDRGPTEEEVGEVPIDLRSIEQVWRDEAAIARALRNEAMQR